MNQLIPAVGTVALLGSALVGGIFFAFSSFLMKALASVPSAEGIGAMQSINVVVALVGAHQRKIGDGALALSV